MKNILVLFGTWMLCLTSQAQVKTPAALPLDKLPNAALTTQELSKEMVVYPNPSTGIVFLSLTGFKGKRIEVRVVNVIGNIVLREYFNQTQDQTTKALDLTQFAKGLYYVKLEAEEYREIRKVIINE